MMMLNKTGRVAEWGAVEGAVLAMAMTMTTARVRRTHSAVRKGLRKGRVHSMGRGKGRGKQPRKGRGWGRETVKGQVLLNKPQEEVISPVPLLCSCRRKFMRHTWTWKPN
jgi:hypothetical protein